MGKRKHRNKIRRKEERFFDSLDPAEVDREKCMSNQGAKNRSKLNKRHKKRLQKEEQRQKEKQTRRPEIKEQCGFHMVTVFVKDELKMDKTFLLSSIGNYVDVPFCPLGYFRGSESITFYFDGSKDIADSIQALNRRIPSPSGELMGIKVSFVEETDVVLNCNQVEILKAVILQRFTSPPDLLDLSALHFDPQFLESNTFVPLFNERILKQVLLMIREHLPNLSALNLSSNKLGISSLKLFEELDLRFISLSAINLENNNLKHLHSVKFLRSLPLKELKLAGNPCNKDIRSSSPKYIKAVRKELPFLKLLDGQNINLITSETDVLRPPKLSPHPSPLFTQIQPDQTPAPSAGVMGEDKLKTFLEQFYALLDSPEKSPLLQAYIPTAKIELKSENVLVPSSSFEGQARIAEFIASWPATKHEHASFSLEILSLSADEGVTRVSGVCLFQEPDVALQFKRTMKIVPFNSGFCCAEDLLEIV